MLSANCQLLFLKDREGDASQLNRLGTTLIDKTRKFVGAQKSVSTSSGSGSNSLLGTGTDDCSAPSKFYGQAERAISTGKLHVSPHFHFPPINQVVFLGPSLPLWVGRSHLEECFPLICIQRLSQPNFATQLCHWHDSWNTRGSSIPVLSY